MTNIDLTAPTWDLSDLYSGRDDKAIEADIESGKILAKKFQTRYEGRLAGLDSASLSEAIEAYEAITQLCGKLQAYAGLIYAKDQSSSELGRFYQSIFDKTVEISAYTLFFTLELNQIEPLPKIDRYQPWVEQIRRFKPHQLSYELESYIHDNAATMSEAWVRLFDETHARLKFAYEGNSLAPVEIFSLLEDPSPLVRGKAATAIAEGLGQHIDLFTMIINQITKIKAVEDRKRRYAHPWSMRHLANQVDEVVVGQLIETVKNNYAALSHRYYRLKAQWLGVPTLNYWDRNAPLPQVVERTFSWDEAKRIVLNAYQQFSPELAAIGQKFFDNQWIDAAVTKGKASGAFAHPCTVATHPYLLLNFQGKAGDIMTLAHELGHGIHQYLARDQGELLAQTPLTLAETASVFGEMLTFQSLLSQLTDPIERQALTASKVEDMLNTVVRQIAFHQFETLIHTERAGGELSSVRIGELWMLCQKASLGDAFSYDASYQCYWSYIPHFIHTPFYVYAYAFGDCLVNSLYQTFKTNGKGFADKYRVMLEAGGSIPDSQLLAPFGLDLHDPHFWQQGLDLIASMIDELETS